MKTKTNLATVAERGPITLQQEHPRPNIGLMLQAITDKGITEASVAVMTQLVALQERLDAKDAEKDFARSFVALQSAMPKVTAMKPVKNNDGSLRYTFAPYEDIMRQVQPSIVANGFTVTFDNKIEEGRVTIICTLMHTSGHSRSNSFTARIGKGPPGSSESQADGSANTYAKRFALCNALNIVIEKDDDARALGAGPLLPATVKELRDRLAAVKGDESKFLAAAHAAQWEAISLDRYEELDGMLFRKEVKAGLRNEQGEWTKF